MNTDLIAYYARRAAEYEAVYAKPERQADLREITACLQELLAGQNVLEIACGTGFWTQRVAQTASTVLALDINASMLEIARQKAYSRENILFLQDDIFHSMLDERFQAVFGGFIWSHIPLQQLDTFLDCIDRWLEPGGTAYFLDNHFVAGSSTLIDHTDTAGNTFQHRPLGDGSMHSVLKNFPDEDFLRARLSGRAGKVTFVQWPYYWLLTYTRSILPPG